MKSAPTYALTIKQPWATLILAGIKTIEVRSWPTARRGRIYIHAGQAIDDRPQGWDLMPESAQDTVQLTGGLLGSVDITECVTYKSREDFARDCDLHRNDPSWFGDGPLYGFCFANPEVLPFRPMSGWFRFFEVDKGDAKRQRKRKKPAL